MPTNSAEHPGPHTLRGAAESFGVDPARYDRARPPYPDALIQRIAAAGPAVLDIGCGTGIEARQLRAAGCAVLGVEPDPRMAEFARGTGIAVEVARFEEWDRAGRTFDAVVAGQSWHWVDPVAGPARAALALRPGGLLAVFAHVFEPPAPIAAALAASFRAAVPDSPFTPPVGPSAREVYRAGFAKVAEDIRAAGGFGEPEQWRFDWERHYTRAQWLDLLPTTGGLTRLPPDTRAGILAAVGAAIGDEGFTLRTSTLGTAATRS